MNALNREFQRLLVSSGWSQARAASELRLDAGTVSRYVAGTVSPSETVLRLFAEILGERLVLDGAIVPPSRALGSRYVEDYEIKLIEALRAMPAEARRRVCEAVTLLSQCVEGHRGAASTPLTRAKAAIVSKSKELLSQSRKSVESEPTASESESAAPKVIGRRSRHQSSLNGDLGS